MITNIPVRGNKESELSKRKSADLTSKVRRLFRPHNVVKRKRRRGVNGWLLTAGS